MNDRLQLSLDKPSFFRWVVDQEGRFELENGRVVDVTAATKQHNRIASNVQGEIRLQLDLDVWSVLSADMAVEIGPNIRFPDVVVERLDAPGGALVAEHAVILVEVLAPSSVGRDMRIRHAEYTQLSALHADIVASHDDARLWVWQRADGATGAFPAEPVEITGLDATLALAGHGLTLPLAALYRGVIR